MSNSECGIKRGGRESSSTKDFSGENAKHDLLIENCYGRSFYGLSQKLRRRRGGGGERKAPSSPPQRRNLCMTAQRYEETASEIKQSKNAARHVSSDCVLHLGTTAQFGGTSGDVFSAICGMQIPRFTSSKPSKFAFASDEKSIPQPTTSFVRCYLYFTASPATADIHPAAP